MDPPGKVLASSRSEGLPEMRRRRVEPNTPPQSKAPPIEPSASVEEDYNPPPPPPDSVFQEEKESISSSLSVEDAEKEIPAAPSPQPPPARRMQPINGSPKNGISPRSPARRRFAGSPPRSPPRSPKSNSPPSYFTRGQSNSPRASAHQPLTASPPTHRYASSAGHLPTFKGQMMETPLDVKPMPRTELSSPSQRSAFSTTRRSRMSLQPSPSPPSQRRSVSDVSPFTSGPLPTVKRQFEETPLDVQPLQSSPPPQCAAAPVAYNSRSPESSTQRSITTSLRNRFVAESRHSATVSALTTPDSGPTAFATPANGGSNNTISERLDETVLPEGAALELIQEGFPLGLTKEMGRMRKVYPLRFWVVDNSGSMLETDCTRLVRGGKGSANQNCYTSVQCSRWDELCQSVETHAHFAGVLESHATFRLLNNPGARVGPQEITVDYIGDAPAVSEVLRKVEPGGSTPLTSHLKEIHDRIAAFAESLRSNDQRAVVILATDGIPSNAYGESPPEVLAAFTEALRSLQELPVWVVVRLCTNEPKVLNYYRSLDSSLEFSFEVIDDYLNEAKEIYQHNKWLNYGRPLHLCREMGYHRRVLDLLDERPLALSELRPFFKILFGRTDFPDPETEWNAFVNHLGTMNEKQQWCPMTKKMADWVDVRKLNSVYNGGLLKSIQRSFTSMGPKG